MKENGKIIEGNLGHITINSSPVPSSPYNLKIVTRKYGKRNFLFAIVLFAMAVLFGATNNTYSQGSVTNQLADNNTSPKESEASSTSASKRSESSERERILLERIEKLEKRLAEIESRVSDNTIQPAVIKPSIASQSNGADSTKNNLQENPQKTPTQVAKAENLKPVEEKQKVPFGFGDFTWMNGQNRQKSSLLNFPDQHLSMNLYLDTYYNYSFNKPKDNTIVGSSTIGRNGEFQINLASVEFSTNYKNVTGYIGLQYGSQLNVIQDLDGTVNRGRNLTTSNLKYIREAAAGYHFDKWYGINVEAGIFPSYIGLESYLTAENWSYNRSLVCDYTPFYFQGARVQIFPTEKIKIEPWFINGFQTYGKWSRTSAIGLSNYYRPSESLGFVANFYYGTDTPNAPKLHRFHHDDSIIMRYYNKPEARGISKMAFSMNNHIGFQHGDGVSRTKAYMSGTSIANRIWFDQDRFAVTVRGEYITNPTRYLAPPPTANGFPPPDVVGHGDNGYSNNIRGITTTFDFMPTDFMAFRLEDLYRVSNEPFFAGPGGTTSPDGFQGTPGPFTPDLRKSEHRLTFAINFRF